MGLGVVQTAQENLPLTEPPRDDLGRLLAAPQLPGDRRIRPGFEPTQHEEGVALLTGEVAACPSVAEFVQDDLLAGRVETAHTEVDAKLRGREHPLEPLAAIGVLVEPDLEGGKIQTGRLEPCQRPLGQRLPFVGRADASDA